MDKKRKRAPSSEEDLGKKQTCLTKFFPVHAKDGTARPYWEFLFQKEEADRKKREEEARRKREEEEERVWQEYQAELAARTEERRLRKEEEQRRREEEKLRKEEYAKKKSEGREIVPGLFLGARLAALNYEWLQENVTHIVNATGEVSNYYESGSKKRLDEREKEAILEEKKSLLTKSTKNQVESIEKPEEKTLIESEIEGEPYKHEESKVIEEPAVIFATSDPKSEETPSAEEQEFLREMEKQEREFREQLEKKAKELKDDLEKQEREEIERAKRELEAEEEEERQRKVQQMQAEVEEMEKSDNLDLVYLKIGIADSAEEKIYLHFERASDFIDKAIAESKGKGVLVHCREGLSRSPTIVIAYLMMRKGMNLKAAYDLVLEKNLNSLRINQGFLQQLVDLDVKLFGVRSLDFFDKKSRRTDTPSESIYTPPKTNRKRKKQKVESIQQMEVSTNPTAIIADVTAQTEPNGTIVPVDDEKISRKVEPAVQDVNMEDAKPDESKLAMESLKHLHEKTKDNIADPKSEIIDCENYSSRKRKMMDDENEEEDKENIDLNSSGPKESSQDKEDEEVKERKTRGRKKEVVIVVEEKEVSSESPKSKKKARKARKSYKDDDPDAEEMNKKKIVTSSSPRKAKKLEKQQNNLFNYFTKT